MEYVHAHNSLPQLWECGIEQCKEIASQLETVTFDYEKLSDIHVSGGNPSCASDHPPEVHSILCLPLYPHELDISIVLW